MANITISENRVRYFYEQVVSSSHFQEMSKAQLLELASFCFKLLHSNSLSEEQMGRCLTEEEMEGFWPLTPPPVEHDV